MTQLFEVNNSLCFYYQKSIIGLLKTRYVEIDSKTTIT